VRSGAPGVYDPLRDPLAIKALQLLNELNILEQHRAIGTRGLRVLVIAYSRTIVTCQVCGLH
jgi:hypothetical protein